MTIVTKGKIVRSDLAVWDGVQPRVTRRDSTGGTIQSLPINDFVDVLQSYGEGLSYTRNTIEQATVKIGSRNRTLMFSPGTWEIDDDLTIGSNFTSYVPAGTVFNIASGKTLTFSGPVIRESTTWTSGSGTVTVNGGTSVPIATAFSLSLLDDPDAATWFATLGISTFISEDLFPAADQEAAFAVLVDGVEQEARELLHVGTRGHLFGLDVTNNVTDAEHDIDIAVGEASSDDTDPVLMKLASALTKRLDATFAEGTDAGGFAAGESLPTSGTIHIWMIAKSDGTVDIFANNHATSALSPTLPTDFIYKRILGSRRTDGSANILATIQNGDDVWLAVTALNEASNPGTSVVTATLANFPTGRKLKAKINVWLADVSPAATTAMLVTSLDQPATAVSVSLFTLRLLVAGATVEIADGLVVEVLTNTSGQIRYQLSASTSDTVVRIFTLGWTDRRGKDA